jgi:acetyl-CoA/propionyl-CoA carboxylase carboxyl transferase subunit
MTAVSDEPRVVLAPPPVRRDPLARLAALFDPGTVSVMLAADAEDVVTAHGRIDGVRTVAYCTDASKLGGAMGSVGSGRIVETIDTARRTGAPVIGLWHSGGARLGEGVQSLDGVGDVFAAMVRASGKVPQISVVLGAAAGGAAYGSALTDFVVIAPEGRVFVTGPDVIRSVTGELVDQETLGGPAAHAKKSGVTHLSADSEEDAFVRTRELVGFLAHPGAFDESTLGPSVDLGTFLPDNPRRAYDVRKLVKGMLDRPVDGGGKAFTELQPGWAPSIVTGFGRLGGRTVGVLANNPMRMGGCLDSESAEKASRFVRLCDAFGVPMAVIVDVPGYLPGVDQEWGGIVRRGAKLLHAFAEATVPRITLITRKAFGGAYIAMNSRSLGATSVFAWPNAEVAVMGAEAAIGILHRRTLAAATDDDRPAVLAGLIAEHERTIGGLHRAVELGAVDEIIEPAETRARLVQAFAAAPARRGAHGNIPL